MTDELNRDSGPNDDSLRAAVAGTNVVGAGPPETAQPSWVEEQAHLKEDTATPPNQDLTDSDREPRLPGLGAFTAG